MEKLPDITEEEWNKVNDFNKKITKDFLKQSTQLSDYTLRQYESALKIFFVYVKDNCDNKQITEIKPRDFLGYQNYLVERGLSSSAVRFKRSAVSSLNSYIEVYYAEDFTGWRSFINKKIIAPPQVKVHEKEPLSLSEYKILCEKLLEQELYQQLAYLTFSFSTGCRRNEARQLLKEVVSYPGKVFEVNDKTITTYITHNIRAKGRGKLGKVRTLQFDEDAMKYIKLWLDKRGEDDCKFVFVAKKNGEYHQVGENTFNLWTEHYFMPIIGRRFTPHGIRTSRATTLTVESGKDISIAQKLLGHESSITTQAYVIKKDKDDSDEAFV